MNAIRIIMANDSGWGNASRQLKHLRTWALNSFTPSREFGHAVAADVPDVTRFTDRQAERIRQAIYIRRGIRARPVWLGIGQSRRSARAAGCAGCCCASAEAVSVRPLGHLCQGVGLRRRDLRCLPLPCSPAPRLGFVPPSRSAAAPVCRPSARGFASGFSALLCVAASSPLGSLAAGTSSDRTRSTVITSPCAVGRRSRSVNSMNSTCPMYRE